MHVCARRGLGGPLKGHLCTLAVPATFAYLLTVSVLHAMAVMEVPSQLHIHREDVPGQASGACLHISVHAHAPLPGLACRRERDTQAL